MDEGVIDLNIDCGLVKVICQFHVTERLRAHCIVSVDYRQDRGTSEYFFLGYAAG